MKGEIKRTGWGEKKELEEVTNGKELADLLQLSGTLVQNLKVS